MKKTTFKTLCTSLLLCALLLTNFIFTAPVTVSASGKIALSKTNLTIQVGKTARLTLQNAKGTIKWKSSNTKVAPVDQQGLITGKKPGSAKITAKASGKSYTCKVTVKYPEIEYISDYQCRYEQFPDGGLRQTVTFHALDKKKRECNIPATIYVKIVNKDGSTVYEAEAKIDENWYCTYGPKNDNYEAVICLPGEEISSGKYSTGKLYLTVIPKGTDGSFPLEMPVCHLPVKK